MASTPPEKNPGNMPLIKEVIAALIRNEFNEVFNFLKARKAIK
jgi:hypothetical protein